jgi:hypothetical protein
LPVASLASLGTVLVLALFLRYFSSSLASLGTVLVLTSLGTVLVLAFSARAKAKASMGTVLVLALFLYRKKVENPFFLKFGILI